MFMMRMAFHTSKCFLFSQIKFRCFLDHLLAKGFSEIQPLFASFSISLKTFTIRLKINMLSIALARSMQ